MGAVSFSLDERLFACLLDTLPISVFVETGTFHGDTVALVAPRVDRVITIESSAALWSRARVRFESSPNVELRLGHSPEEIARIRPTLDGPTLYWLDAHWCGAAAVDHEGPCPLLEELKAIGDLGDASLVLIDDARLFLAPPLPGQEAVSWPSFDEIVTALRCLSDRHALMVVNDVIAFYPKRMGDVMDDYATRHGVDWLSAARALEEISSLRDSLQEKERVIQRQHRELVDHQGQLSRLNEANQAAAMSLHSKEEVIQRQHLAIQKQQLAIQKQHLAIREVQDALGEANRRWESATLPLRVVSKAIRTCTGLWRRFY